MCDPLDTGDDAGVGAGSAGIEDLDGDEVGVLGNAVSGASDGTRAVSSVAVLIGIS